MWLFFVSKADQSTCTRQEYRDIANLKVKLSCSPAESQGDITRAKECAYSLVHESPRMGDIYLPQSNELE